MTNDVIEIDEALGYETNEQLLTRLMCMNSNMQEFIFTAIIAYCDACIKAGAEKFDNAMINGEGWIRGCTEAINTVREHRSTDLDVNIRVMQNMMTSPRCGALMHMIVFTALENVADSFIKRNRADLVDSASFALNAVRNRRKR
jgi:hypothetical protein